MLESLPLTTERSKADFGTTIFYAVFATVSVVARMYCKKITINRFGLDDITILAALAFCLGMCGTNLIEIKLGGMGRHVKDIPPNDLVVLLKNIIVFQVMWGLSLMFVKISFLLFFSKIFSVGKSHIVFKLAMIPVLLWGLGDVLTSLLVCQPLAFNWNRNIPGGRCGNRPASYICIGVFHIVTDVMVLTIPIPFLWRLQMPTSRKISLSAIFCLGFICCIISFVRVVELSQVTYNDITYSLVPGSYWTLLEPALAIFVASLPAIAPVFDRTASQFRRQTGRFTSGSSQGKAFQQLDDAKYPLSSSLTVPKDDVSRSDSASDLEAAGPRDMTRGKEDDFGSRMDLFPSPPAKAITKTTTIAQVSSDGCPQHMRKGSTAGFEEYLGNEYTASVNELSPSRKEYNLRPESLSSRAEETRSVAMYMPII